MAGDSAREVARRQRERAERLTRAAEKWERGAEGETATAAHLDNLPAPWRVLHDVRWPGRERANIDHVVVGPGGVFVIDTKNWSGKVVVVDDVLRQNGRQREQAVVGVAEAAMAVAAAVPGLDVRLVVPVLCFARDEPVEGWARDVMVCSTANVLTMLTTRVPALDEAQVAQHARTLQAALAPATAGRPPGSPSPVRRQARAAAAPAPRTRGRQRRSRGGALAPLVVGLGVVVGTLLFQEEIGDFVSDLIVPTVEVEPEPAPEKPRDRP